MGKPIQRWEIALIIAVTAFLMIMALIAISMEFPDRNNWHDGPDLDPDRANLEQLRTDQVGLFFWDTEFNVTFVRSATGFPVNATNLSCHGGGGNVLEGANYTYHDLDLDGLVSPGDRIRIENMSDRYYGSSFQMEVNGTPFAFMVLDWDLSDRLIYTIGINWVYPALRNGSQWDTTFQLTHFRTDEEVPCEELRFKTVDREGAIELTEAVVSYNDTDGNGLVSIWDRVELTGMTDDYEGARVWISFQGHVIGIAELPNFIPRP